MCNKIKCVFKNNIFRNEIVSKVVLCEKSNEEYILEHEVVKLDINDTAEVEYSFLLSVEKKTDISLLELQTIAREVEKEILEVGETIDLEKVKLNLNKNNQYNIEELRFETFEKIYHVFKKDSAYESSPIDLLPKRNIYDY